MSDAFGTAEVSRRLDLIVADGVIESVGADGSVRVRLETELVTDDLRVLGGLGGGAFAGAAPSVGEPVVVLSPTGELTQGRVLRGMSSDAFPHPLLSEGVIALLWRADELLDAYDSGTMTRTIRVPAGGKLVVEVEGGGRAELTDGLVRLSGDMIALGDGVGLRGVARIGDTVAGGVITGGSTVVKAA